MLREYAFDDDAVVRHNLEVPRAWISVLMCTPCFPCVFVYFFSPEFEDRVREAQLCRRVSLTTSGVRFVQPTASPQLSTITIPYDCIVRCAVDAPASHGPPCKRVPGELSSVTLTAHDSNCDVPLLISFFGLSSPHDFVDDVLSMRRHGVLAVPLRRATPTANEVVAKTWQSFWNNVTSSRPAEPLT